MACTINTHEAKTRCPSARSAHRSQLGKAGLERRHQRVDLRFGHRRGERARTRADDDATFVVEVIEQRLKSARLVGRRERIAVSSWRRLLHVHQKHRARALGYPPGQLARMTGHTRHTLSILAKKGKISGRRVRHSATTIWLDGDSII